MKKSKLIKVLVTEIEMSNAHDHLPPNQIRMSFDREEIKDLCIEECIDDELKIVIGEIPDCYTYEIL